MNITKVDQQDEDILGDLNLQTNYNGLARHQTRLRLEGIHVAEDRGVYGRSLYTLLHTFLQRSKNLGLL